MSLLVLQKEKKMGSSWRTSRRRWWDAVRLVHSVGLEVGNFLFWNGLEFRLGMVVSFWFLICDLGFLIWGFSTMESSSSTNNHSLHQYIRFRNRKCFCDYRAEVMISESAKNPNQLLFRCAWKKCKFFEWWSYESDNGASNVTTEVASDKAEEFASQNKRHESVGLQGDGLMLLH